jgi:hypothetical protein
MWKEAEKENMKEIQTIKLKVRQMGLGAKVLRGWDGKGEKPEKASGQKRNSRAIW